MRPGRVYGLSVTGAPILASLVLASLAYAATPALCASVPPKTVATYSAERGHHVVRFQSVDRTGGREGAREAAHAGRGVGSRPRCARADPGHSS